MPDHELNWAFAEIGRLAVAEISPRCTTQKATRLLDIGLVSFDKLRKLLSEKENQENAKDRL